MTMTSNRRKVLFGGIPALAAATLAACAPRSSPTPEPRATSSVPRGISSVPRGTVGLGIVGIVVADLGAALAFYRSLGLTVPEGVDTSQGSYRHTMPNGTILYWETIDYVRAYFPGYERGTGDRRVVLEFGFASANDVDAMYHKLVANGAKAWTPLVSWGDIRHGIVTDPDDNQISLRFPFIS